MSDTAARVKKIIAEHLGLVEDSLKDDAHILDDLGADSLDTVELVMALEEEFGIDIPDEKMDAVGTVGQAIAIVQQLLP